MKKTQKNDLVVFGLLTIPKVVLNGTTQGYIYIGLNPKVWKKI
jgi:hypothetical protein